jgi:hypothetical protein
VRRTRGFRTESNPEAKLEEYIAPHGRGLRYHSEGTTITGATFFGFLNPDVGSVKGIQAERDRQDPNSNEANVQTKKVRDETA